MAFAAKPSGSASGSGTRVVVLTGRLPALSVPVLAEPAARRSAEARTRTARSVKRENGLAVPEGNRSAALVGTKRFCAACFETPLAPPIWLHGRPDLRAWSTK